MADLDDLRARIDQLDGALIAIVAERLAVCRQVASVKEGSDTPVIQPARVRDVVETRRQQAIDAGVDPDFVEQLFRVLLTETHRIEVAGHRPDAAPEKPAATGESRSGLDTVASRVDHIVIAVDDLDVAVEALQSRFGFRRVAMAGVARRGICTLAAGGVTLVLVGPQASPSVAEYLERNGQGVQHVAIEVLNAGFARAVLADAGAPLLTEVIVDADGHEQFFAVTEPAAGIQLGFISRTGHRVGVGADNVLALFDAIRTTSP
ncbi:MAG TPA: chorismate mutase [Ilumatobacteraceae bacterium]|jgi:chorismate mutase-like protein|nr:chorismate mutase [Ilumatobacteraceae bacterium]